MSSKKCTFNPEKARMAAENVRSYMKLRGQDFDVMVEESDKILRSLSEAELKAVVKEFDAFARSIKHFPKGQLKEVADKVVFSSNMRVPGRTVHLNPRRSIFVRGGTTDMPEMTDAEIPEMTGGEHEGEYTEPPEMMGGDNEGDYTEPPEMMGGDNEGLGDLFGGSSQRGRSRSRSRSVNSQGSNHTHRSHSSHSSHRSHRSHRSRRSRSRSHHMGPQGHGLIPGAVRVAALMIPRSKTRFFQTIMWMAIITMAGYSGMTDGSFIQVGLQQIQSGNCEGGWGSFDWNRHPLCTAWKALKTPIVTGMNDMYKLDKQGFFKLLAGLGGLVMAPIVLNSGFYWLAYFMDYQITLMVSAFLNIEFVAPEAQEPGLFRMLALYRQVTNPLEALLWGRRLMGNSRRSRSRHRSRSIHRSRSRSIHRSRSRHSSTGNLVELARIRALQNMVRQERNRSARSPSPASLNSSRRRHTVRNGNRNRNRNNQNRNSRWGNNNSNRNTRRSNRNRRSSRGSRR